jgi:hypothetical protein
MFLFGEHPAGESSRNAIRATPKGIYPEAAVRIERLHRKSNATRHPSWYDDNTLPP